MSWQAARYVAPERMLDSRSLRLNGDPNRITRHHVPPRNPARALPSIRIDERRHRAYHLLFANAASFEDCVQILRRDWWPF